jgi:hypothetical protein
VTVNPLVAGRLDQPTDAWSGVWIAEDIELIGQGVRNGSWVDGSLGVVGAGLDALAIVSDPVGALLQYGVAWIIEHVKPLTEALDWLAGSPGQIAGHAQTWRNVAGSLRDSAANVDRAVRWDVAEWGGTAGPAYRAWAGQQYTALDGLAKAADTMAAITEGAGMLIAAVRILVRDAIATCVSRLIVYAAEEAFSLGVATPLVVEQVSTLVASWAGKIARWLKALLASLRRLIPSVHRLGELIEELKKILNRLRGKGAGSRDPHDPGRSGKPPSKYDQLSDADLIRDRGDNVGRPGSGPKVREVRSEEDLQEYFDALTRNGSTDITPPGFPGKMVQLPDGTIVNWRTKSKTTGSIPTIDVNPGNGQNFKVHVNPNGW